MNRIKMLRQLKNMNQTELAKILNVKSQQVISSYESGRTNIPLPKAEKLAEIFGVSVKYLLGYSDEKSERLNKNMTPVLGNVSAGLPIFSESNIEDYVISPYDDNSDIFALRISGNSMNLAGLPDGSLIYVHKQSYVENGTIAVVRVNDAEMLVKKFYQNERKVTLRPCSTDPEFQDQIYDLTQTSVHIIGKVIGVFNEIQ